MTSIRRRRAPTKNGDSIGEDSAEMQPRKGSAAEVDIDSTQSDPTPSESSPLALSGEVMKASRKYKVVQWIWCLHFFLGFLVVYAGIVKNGGDR
jgi:hypothetical protein